MSQETHGTQDATDARAQSEVIGVVFIVGIVVVLAAFAGMFIFDMVDDDLEDHPQARFQVEQYGDDTRQARLYHDGGDVIENTDAINVTVDGVNVPLKEGIAFENADGKIDSQTSIYFAKNASTGDVNASRDPNFGGAAVEGLDEGTTIRVIWNPEESRNSAILFEYEIESRA